MNDLSEAMELAQRLALVYEPGRSAEPFIKLLISVRSRLRANRQYVEADAIRARLAELGIVLEDGRHGTTWRASALRAIE